MSLDNVKAELTQVREQIVRLRAESEMTDKRLAEVNQELQKLGVANPEQELTFLSNRYGELAQFIQEGISRIKCTLKLTATT